MTDRRSFLKEMTALTSALILPQFDLLGNPIKKTDKWGELLPTRKFGKTGSEVTMLGLGGAHVGRSDEKVAQAIIEKAMEKGVRFFDNAESYQGGRAEQYYGRFLVPKYRDEVFIMTKSTGKNLKIAREHFEGSLQRMKLDYLDLWQIHSIRSPKDVDDRIANGVLDFALEMQAKGKVRHIGFTGHTRFQAHKHMLESQNVLETCQMPINMFDPNYKSFINNVLPILTDQDYGVIAMKTLSNGGFFGGTTFFEKDVAPRIIPNKATVKEALHFVWSLPVSVLVSGVDSVDMLEENIQYAQSFAGMTEDERSDLIARVQDFDGGKVEYYKA